MALRAKILTLLLVFSFVGNSTSWPTMQADELEYQYGASCQGVNTTEEQYYNRRLYGDGLGNAEALHELSKDILRRETKLSYDEFETPIFIFGTYGVKGGNLFASAHKLIKQGFRNLTIVFSIDYFRPIHDSNKVCHEILLNIERLAESSMATVMIYWFRISPETNLGIRGALADIQRIEEQAKKEGLMNSKSGKLYAAIDTLDIISKEDFKYGILVDGIAGIRFEGFSPDHRLQTLQRGMLYFAQKANEFYANGTTIVVNTLASGMDKDTGVWLTTQEYRFPFHSVLCPGWPINAIKGDAFFGKKIHWTFFQLPPPAWTPGDKFSPPQRTLFQNIRKYISGLTQAKQTPADRERLTLLSLLIEIEKNNLKLHALPNAM